MITNAPGDEGEVPTKPHHGIDSVLDRKLRPGCAYHLEKAGAKVEAVSHHEHRNQQTDATKNSKLL
jgi:hypothetical protein